MCVPKYVMFCFELKVSSRLIVDFGLQLVLGFPRGNHVSDWVELENVVDDLV